MFSKCATKCAICSMGDGGCLAGSGDDDFFPASNEELENRLKDSKWAGFHQEIEFELISRGGIHRVPKKATPKKSYTPLKVMQLQLEPFELTEMPVEEEQRLRYEIQQKLKVVALAQVDFFDQTITEAIVQAAREAGIHTLVTFDKDFVVAAIREKMEREGMA